MNAQNVRALAVTVFGLALFEGVRRTPIPYTSQDAVLSLGLGPAVSAFLIVELLSWLVPPLTRYRSKGVEGRRKLNRVAWALTGVLALCQGLFYARYLLYSQRDSLGLPSYYDSRSEAVFLVVAMLTLAGGSALTYLLAIGLSRFAVANGFCILSVGYHLFGQVLSRLGQMASSDQSLAKPDLDWFILHAATIAGACWFLRNTWTVQVDTQGNAPLTLELPALPQGLPALTLAAMGVAAGRAWQLPLTASDVGYGFGLLVLVVVFSGILYLMFSSPGRIRESLPEPLQIDDSLPIRVRRRTWLGLAVLLGGWVGLAFITTVNRTTNRYELPEVTATMVLALSAAALLLDGFDQWQFHNRNGEGVRVVEFDNTHVAAFARALLLQHGIDCFVQTYHWRRLYFDLSPLMKMTLYVAPSQADKAKSLLMLDQMRTV